MKALTESQFGYRPLICMFCGRNLKNRINHLHERSLRTVYNDYDSSFQETLELDNSVSIQFSMFQFSVSFSDRII